MQEATTAADLTVSCLERLRTEERFHSFCVDVVKKSRDLTEPPCDREACTFNQTGHDRAGQNRIGVCVMDLRVLRVHVHIK